MSDLTVRLLDASTWPDFARLVEKHDGVWGGCWCMSFHAEGTGSGRTPAQNRTDKEQRVRTGNAHAALVFDGADCVGWCQFGPTEELPRIKRKRAYDTESGTVPDWRITCFFVDRERRQQGVAATALEGALTEIARQGGGLVESYPEDVHGGRTTSSSFLHNATASLFDKHGFERGRQIGKHHWVVTKIVPPSR